MDMNSQKGLERIRFCDDIFVILEVHFELFNKMLMTGGYSEIVHVNAEHNNLDRRCPAIKQTRVIDRPAVSFGQQMSRQRVEEGPWGSFEAVESLLELPYSSSAVPGWQAFGKRYVYRVIDVSSNECTIYVGGHIE